MLWKNELANAWAFVLSTFTQDYCQRCGVKKYGVMKRRGLGKRLCDLCTNLVREENQKKVWDVMTKGKK